jgi:hypothetical protein
MPKNRFSVLIECAYCHNSFRKNKNGVDELGKISSLPPDMSFIQIGTCGTFQGDNFSVIGRIKVSWEQGNWNEWIAQFENGKIGWIGDFIGRLTVSFKDPSHSCIDFTSLSVGQHLTIGNKMMTITDIKKVNYIGFEGEIPFERQMGDVGFSVDLQSQNEDCAFIDHFHNQTNIYVGCFIDADDLKLENIRLIDGW